MEQSEIERKVGIIEKKLDNLPAEIKKTLSETMDLKIQNAIQALKIEFYKWLVPLCLGIIGSLAMALYGVLVK